MDPSPPQPRAARFGLFEADFGQRILTKGGLRIKLQDQPFQVLRMLLDRPGELITREEIRQRLWPADTFVEFDDGLNTAVKKLRAALNDSADNPRFIETVPRRGYRFLAPVTTQVPAHQTESAETEQSSPSDCEPPTSNRHIASSLGGSRISSNPFPGAPHWTRSWRILTVVILTLSTAVLFSLLFKPQVFSKRPFVSEKATLIVIPLDNLSGDPQQEYFSDGFTEEISTQLARLAPDRLGVIGRLTAMRYKHSGKDIAQIAKEIPVQYVLEGSVRREQARIRVTVQLIEVARQTHVWAEEYDRELGDVLGLQQEIATAIASQIKLKLTPEQAHKLVLRSATTPEAHDAYLKGRYEWNKRTTEDLKKSIQYFLEAIEKDSSYADGHEGLAEAYSVLPDYDVMTPAESYPKARTEALRALELDPTLSEAHATLGTVKEEFEWDWSGADREFQLAIELGPGSATAHHWYSEYLLRVGRTEEGLAQIREALELDPASPVMNAELGGDLYWARQFDQAIQQLHKAIEMEPRFAYTHSWLGFAYEQKGAQQQAIEEFQKAVALSEGSPGFRAALGYAYGLAGQASEARKISDELTQLSHSTSVYVSPYDLALLHVGLREKEQALKSLETAFTERDPALDLLKIEPALDSLRSDPRFALLVRRVGLAR